ncbi:MAG: PP2C family protein-serine/threonine phosphatase [bacterium]
MNARVETAAITDKGLSSQTVVNEDSYVVLEREGVYAVADGVGGAHAGDVASQAALAAIKKLVIETKQNHHNPKLDSIGFVKQLIRAGNEVVYEKGRQKGRQMATTIAILVIEDDHAVIGHVGDSRIYVHREGDLVQLTRDHSKRQTVIDSDPQKSSVALIYPDRNIITKALGAEPHVDPDIQKVLLKNEDIYVICTDGIYIHNSDDEILTNVQRNGKNLQTICEQFKDNCYKRGAKDNLTAIVLRIRIEKPDAMETRVI